MLESLSKTVNVSISSPNSVYLLYILEIMLVEDTHPTVPSWWIVPFAWGIKLCFSLILSDDGLAWWRIHLPMQETQVQSLVWKDSTCHRAAKPTCHNYWSPGALDPYSVTRETTAVRRLCTATREQPLLAATRERPGAAVKTQHSQNKFFKDGLMVTLPHCLSLG